MHRHRPEASLTAEESAAVNLLASGLGRQATARRMGLSVRQVHRLTRSIRHKLDVSNDLQMGIAVYRRGLLHPDVAAQADGRGPAASNGSAAARFERDTAVARPSR